MNSDAIDETVANDMMTMITESPGKVQLFFQIHDTKTNGNIVLRSSKVSVNIKHKLVNYIDVNPEMDYKIN